MTAVVFCLLGSALLQDADARGEVALLGRYVPRQDLPAWLRVPRWCTFDAPPWGAGQTASLVTGYADRGATAVRMGLFWGGLAHFPSRLAPPHPNLKPGVDPLGEALEVCQRRGLHLLAYLNPNALYDTHPLYDTACLVDATGQPWPVKAYGRDRTRYACSNHPAWLDFYRRAIGEVVARDGVAGIYVDGLTPHGCCCRHCREQYRRDTGQELPVEVVQAFGPQTVMWEMTSECDVRGNPADPALVAYSRWLARCLARITAAFRDAARAARPDAVVVFHTWPKADIQDCYDATLNEIYARSPWRLTLWKQGEFSNWGDVFAVPSLNNVYLRKEPWQGTERAVTSETEARHLYWQALANGAYPNAWSYLGMARPFAVMRDHADCFDFATTFPLRGVALARPMFRSAVHEAIRTQVALPLRPGTGARLRILEREPHAQLDLLCLRADGREPSDAEYRSGAPADVVYLPAGGFDATRSVLTGAGREWAVTPDPDALSGRCVAATGLGRDNPQLALEYALPPLGVGGPWQLWARARFPNVGADSVYWQVSNDAGATWLPATARDDCALGWRQGPGYQWVPARAELPTTSGATDRFTSPAAGLYAALLHAGLPVKQLHPNHLTTASLAGHQVLLLANEVSLSASQCEAVREFVRAGGALLATGETSLYDERGERRADFGLADLFGASWVGDLPAGERLVGLPGGDVPHHETSVLVRATTGTVVAHLRGPGLDAPAPAVLRHTFGRGRVIYLPGRLDADFSWQLDRRFSDWLRQTLREVVQPGLPARIEAAGGLVGLTCFDQPGRGRWLLHLLSYEADPVAPFDSLGQVGPVTIRVRPPGGRVLAGCQAVFGSAEVTAVPEGDELRVTVPAVDEYAVVELRWAIP